MFKKFVNWIRQVIDKMIRMDTIEGKLHKQPAVSDDMTNAIELWLDLYSNKAPWLAKNKQSLGLPQAIAEEFARQVTLEMKVNVNEKVEEGAEPSLTAPIKEEMTMASYLAEQITPVIKKLRTELEYCCAGGGLALKPYVDGNKICVDFVKANEFIPLAFNGRKEITSVAFIEQKQEGKKYFTRLEVHTLKDNTYTVENKAYVSYYADDMGVECPLTDVDEWKELSPTPVTIQNVEKTLFGYIAIPKGNPIEPNSPLGVSVYANAISLIEDADKQYQRFLWEYEGGELAIDASVDAFDTRKDGTPIYPEGKERLFRNNTLDSATTSGGDLMKTFSPSLRDSSYWNGLNKILQRVEDKCCLSRGTFSDVTSDARTATEIKMMKQRSASAVTDIQMSAQNGIEDLIYAMSVYAQLYSLAPAGEYETAFVWDDSIIVDSEAERIRDMQEVTQGLMQAWEYRVKWYGEDEATAKKVLGETEENPEDDLFDEDDDDLEEEEILEESEEGLEEGSKEKAKKGKKKDPEKNNEKDED